LRIRGFGLTFRLVGRSFLTVRVVGTFRTVEKTYLGSVTGSGFWLEGTFEYLPTQGLYEILRIKKWGREKKRGLLTAVSEGPAPTFSGTGGLLTSLSGGCYRRGESFFSATVAFSPSSFG